MSATSTCSSTLWIVAFTTPTSTTCAPVGAMKRPSEVPPVVEAAARPPGHLAHGAQHQLRECAGRGEERLPRDEPLERVVEAMPVEDRDHGALQRLDGLHGGEPQVEAQLELAGDHVRRAGTRGDVRDLEARGLEVLVARVPARRGELRQRRCEAMHRVVGELRIRDVSLRAMDGQPAGQRSAAPDLDRVAEDLVAARLADDAPVDALAARLRAFRSTRLVPSIDGPSSSLVSRKASVPR